MGSIPADRLLLQPPTGGNLGQYSAYATLALTPLRGFSLVASVPLALSVLVVAQRFAWPRVQILGIVCTYGLYILRGQVFGFGDLDPTTFMPYVALAVYWVVFEAADLANLVGRTAGRSAPAPLFLLNAAGLVGAALLQLPTDTPIPLSTFLMIAGMAYVASAVVRARLTGQPAAGEGFPASASFHRAPRRGCTRCSVENPPRSLRP